MALARDLQGAGVDVLTYDARGHGRSEGVCGLGSTEHADVAAAVAAASCAQSVVLVGVSMGAIAVMTYLTRPVQDAAGAQVSGAVLVSAPARWRMRPSPVGLATLLVTRTRLGRYVAARHLGVRVAEGWIVGESLESRVKRTRVPVAVVHGLADRLLAPSHGQWLEAASTSSAAPFRLELVKGMGHGPDAAGRPAIIEALQWVLTAPTTTPGR